MTTTADLATLTAPDVADMLGAVHGLPAQFPDGLARARSVQSQLQASWPSDSQASPRALVICGMGGSGVGADLLPAATETRAPVIAIKGYDLPTWVGDEDRVVCCSYSGATAETLSCFRQAIEQSVVTAVITAGGELADLARANGVPVIELPSGMQPRAAVGVLFAALAVVAESLHVIEHADQLVADAQAGAQVVVDEHLDNADPAALRFARELHDSVVIVTGAGHTEAVAHRWKAQVNENGKVPSWANALPELDHNELVGWEFARSTGTRWALVELLPFEPSEAMQARFDVTARISEDALEYRLRLEPKSTSRAGATFEQMIWGDYVSVFLALVRGIDPSPVNRIQALKAELAGR